MSDVNEPVSFWQAATAGTTVRRALKVALIVGTLLCLINQWEAITAGFSSVNWYKFFLTYLVPFGVSTYSTAASRMDLAKRMIACRQEEG